LPLVPGKSRNKINTMLANAVANWKTGCQSAPRLILPLIITRPSILTRKPERDDKLKVALECYERSQANGIWIVDTKLMDQNRNEQFSRRYSKLIEFHQNLRESVGKEAILVAGPYWGIDMVLWARGLCDFLAMSVGTPYTYYISYGIRKSGNTRVAIPPIRRRAVMGNALKIWLDEAIAKLKPEDAAFRELTELKKTFRTLQSKETAVNQVARFYKEWFRKIEAIAPEGRALGLFQDLSSAFVLGRQLPPLPKEAEESVSENVRNAGMVAEQLMLHCL
jgi:hypothetical protein